MRLLAFQSTTLRDTAIAVAATAMMASAASATPANDFVGTVQWTGVFTDLDLKNKTDTLDMKFKAKGPALLVVTRFAVGPSGTSGWHSHPGFSMVTVLSGSITLYDAQLCTGRTLTAGQTFVDEGGDHVHLVRNESGAPAQLGAVQIVENVAPALRRVDAPRPNNCAAGVQ